MPALQVDPTAVFLTGVVSHQPPSLPTARTPELRAPGLMLHDADDDARARQSMGGVGTWALAAAHPELFAAIVPICGGVLFQHAGNYETMTREERRALVRLPLYMTIALPPCLQAVTIMT